ncbi:AMP-binding protein [Corallococcus carmarthensis]|uniref:4-coumarate--CoA ligase n=1 Tax=Corallococcus carmarthensis TaxID=2316728 RepID=A0A3A8KC40_9BACT|nr:AMP-binding protein [Corallococcus carmarthensis]RKH05723.1 4-coumarate--CoA ligase [Corallococcus carmarthensis]
MVEPLALEHLLAHGRPPRHPVARCEDGVRDSGAFRARVAGWCEAFTAHGGQRYALFTEDTFDFATALLGAWHAGACVYLPADARPATLDALKAHVDGFAGRAPQGQTVLTPLAPAANEDGASTAFQPLSPELAALVVYTSGSSGEPTAIPKRLSQLSSEVATLGRLFDADSGDVPVLATVSHQHIYGLLFRVLWPLTSGRPFDAHALPYPEDILAALQSGPGLLVASPAHLKRLPSTLDWASVRGNLRGLFSSGGPLTPEALQACRDLLGRAPVEVYGSSETGGVAWRRRDTDDSASWRTMPGVEVRADEDALRVRSPHLPAGGWFTTEDRARAVPGGFELLGRRDRLLKLEEKRVSLSAMERTLVAGGLLREARVLPLTEGHRVILAVVGVPDADGWRLQESGGRRSLSQALREKLAPHFESSALPRRFRYLEAMPVNSQGKSTEAALAALFDPKRPPFRVLERSGERVLLEVEVPANSPYFDGHFPGSPILPGVVQLEWSLLLGREHFALPPDFLRLETLKFQQVISPGTQLTLELTWAKESGKLGFKLTSAKGSHASGRIVLGGGAG